MSTETTTQEFDMEVHLQVEFKMNEFLTGVKNRLARKHGQAFDMTRQSHDVWKAFEEVSEAIKKEIDMPLPYDNMTKQKKWEAKEMAVAQIVKTLDLQGRDYDRKIKSIVSIVETAQNY